MALDATCDMDGLLERLAKIRKELESPKSLHTAIATALLNKTEARFAKQDDPWGNPWKPSQRVLDIRSGKSRERRKKKGLKSSPGPGLTLVDTGRLRGSFAVGTEGKDVFLGQMSNVVYFKYHQWGTRNQRGASKMAARPMMPLRGAAEKPSVDLPPSYEADIEKLIKDWGDGLFSK
jgi:phage gpG-like protein